MRISRGTVLLALASLLASSCAGIGSADEAGGTTPAKEDQSAGPSPVSTVAPGAPSRIQTPPDVDLSRHSVPLEEVYFDTFDGEAVPLSESTVELRRRLLDAIPPIDQPVYGDASAGSWLLPVDLVVGYSADDQAFAFPFKILNFHEIVNDELGGLPVLISYCPLCRSAVVYDRRVDGQVLSFGNTSALYESDLVMVDRATGSYWWQVAGTAIVGPLTGTRLEPLPSLVTTWADWVDRHPETQILSRETGFDRPYEIDSFVDYVDFLDSGRFPFPVGEASRDPRLGGSVLVVGVTIDGVTRAYPIDRLTDPINDVIGEVPIVVFPTEVGGEVFEATIGDELLEFRREGDAIVDAGSGSRWVGGVAVAGARFGTALKAVPSRTAFWFSIAGAFPNLELYEEENPAPRQ